MATFCRITGHARNLPKPCYFPLLPPITPAEAKKLCRVTGKASELHRYSPAVAFGRPVRYDGAEGCRITRHESLSFVRLVLEGKGEGLPLLQEVLAKMSLRLKKRRRRRRRRRRKEGEEQEEDGEKKKKEEEQEEEEEEEEEGEFVYDVPDLEAKLVVPREVEEAIRTGEVESVSVRRDALSANLKLRRGRVVKVGVRASGEGEAGAALRYGRGQNQQVLEEQQKALEERRVGRRKANTAARKRRFEALDAKAEEEEKRDTVRPPPKRTPRVRFDARRRAEKLARMEAALREQEGNRAILLPKWLLEKRDAAGAGAGEAPPRDEDLLYERMLSDVALAQASSIKLTVVASGFDWHAAEAAESCGFDWDAFPRQEWVEPLDVPAEDALSGEGVALLEVVAVVEAVRPAPPMPKEVAGALSGLRGERLKETEGVGDALGAARDPGIIPAIGDVPAIAANVGDAAEVGYLVRRPDGAEFVRKGELEDEGEGAPPFVSGAMVDVGDARRKFVSGQVIRLAERETFVSGQTVETPKGKRFVPGQTVLDRNGDISFVPGQCVRPLEEEEEEEEAGRGSSCCFVAGQIFQTPKGPAFVAGQVMDRGDGRPSFVAGQTVVGADGDGPRFCPGGVAHGGGEEEDADALVFVPGLSMPTASGDTFVGGQTFPSEGGATFKPGRIVDTDEGPTFVPGRAFDTPEGPRFVRGDLVQDPEGNVRFERRPAPEEEEEQREEEEKEKEEEEEEEEEEEDVMIPNRELKPLAIAERHVVGFVVNPTNTEGIPVGERLHGDLVETQEEAVRFYLTGRLPEALPRGAKVIPGQLLVSEEDQRFIPGRVIEGRFVPGQTVRTGRGEAFVPGQIVGTAERPKFVPGQVVATSRGERFVPGQVMAATEEEEPRFVPGQIVETENGATFIPGQMVEADGGGRLFVPGQVVETLAGPRFVPGQVAEGPGGPRFVPGTVVDTDEGLKYVPDEVDEGFGLSFQGFEVGWEEMALLAADPAVAPDPMDLLGGEGVLIDSETLKRLSADAFVVHGVTPEREEEVVGKEEEEEGEGKEEEEEGKVEVKKKKKKARVQLDAGEEEEDEEEEGEEEEEEEDEEEDEPPDEGTDKVDVLLKFIQASLSLTDARREREMAKLARMLGGAEPQTPTATQAEAMAYILASEKETGVGDVLRAFLGGSADAADVVSDVVDRLGSTNALGRNDEARKALRTAVSAAVASRCDAEIDALIRLLGDDPRSLLTDARAQALLTEAVGVVCVTGNVEAAAMLERFISEPSGDAGVLRENEDVASVLRQLLVLRRMADGGAAGVAGALQALQANPEGLKDRGRIRGLLGDADMLLKSPTERRRRKRRRRRRRKKRFDLRHVASSKDIPKEVFDQIREDRREADRFASMLPDELFRAIRDDGRCGEALLSSLASSSSSELERFRRGTAIVVAKAETQAVIPREMARSICYGIVPYLLIDEEGFKFFERGLTGRRLAPARVIENTWYMPDSYYARKPSFQRGSAVASSSGEQYSLSILGRRRPSAGRELLYTSLLPPSGPTRLSYPDAGRSGSPPPSPPSSSYASRRSSRRGSGVGGDPTDFYVRRWPEEAEDPPADFCVRRRRGRMRMPEEAEEPPADFYVRRRFQEGAEAPDLDFGARGSSLLTEEEAAGASAAPICRSDTVAKLLDKYTNFSPKREFGYRAPDSAWARHVGRNASSSSKKKKKKKEKKEATPEALYDLRGTPPASGVGRRRLGGDAPPSGSRERSRSQTPISSSGDAPVPPAGGGDTRRGLSCRRPEDVLGSRTPRLEALFGDAEGGGRRDGVLSSRRREEERKKKKEARDAPAGGGRELEYDDDEEEVNGALALGRRSLRARGRAAYGDEGGVVVAVPPLEMNGGLEGPQRERPRGGSSYLGDHDWTTPFGRSPSEDLGRSASSSSSSYYARDPYCLLEDPYGRRSQDPPFLGRPYDGYTPRVGYHGGLGYGDQEPPALGGYSRRPDYGYYSGSLGLAPPPPRGVAAAAVPAATPSYSSRKLPYIDEEEDLGPPAEGGLMTPREAERLRIARMASKYLRNPSPSSGGGGGLKGDRWGRFAYRNSPSAPPDDEDDEE